MRTFFIQTLGCRVNHYESEQIATVLRSHGLVEADARTADLRIINSCSVTVDAASKSRQMVRRAVRLAVLQAGQAPDDRNVSTIDPFADPARDSTRDFASPAAKPNSRTIVAGCWATGDKKEVENLPGVDAVLTHHQDVAHRLRELLNDWSQEDSGSVCSRGDDGGTPNLMSRAPGANSLPLLDRRQARHQRAFLKIQDGCDAHCTYCIIPNLRPTLWSKPQADVLEEARALVDAGHRELVLTGIFLGAYGHPTALRRRQEPGGPLPLARLIDALCTQVPGLTRLRLSSLEPGDLDDNLLAALRAHEQVVPHFHLPLQSGSTRILKRMNRQYTQADFRNMLDRIHQAYDRPALTTDIIAGFPGETTEDFQETLDVVAHARFIHIHAFPFSPRPGTAAARWQEDFVRGPVVGQRIDLLTAQAQVHSQAFRETFVGDTVQLLVERTDARHAAEHSALRHGRCERYFDVSFESDSAAPGDLVTVRITQATAAQTLGKVVSEPTAPSGTVGIHARSRP